jgi:hypothetical protein
LMVPNYEGAAEPILIAAFIWRSDSKSATIAIEKWIKAFIFNGMKAYRGVGSATASALQHGQVWWRSRLLFSFQHPAVIESAGHFAA